MDSARWHRLIHWIVMKKLTGMKEKIGDILDEKKMDGDAAYFCFGFYSGSVWKK